MTTKTFCIAVLAAACMSPAWSTGFTGPADPALFTIANVGTLTGGSPTLGTATFGAGQLVLVGADSMSPNPGADVPGCSGGVWSTVTSPCQIQVTLSSPGTFAFDWSYASADPDGPAGDLFGFIVDGTRTALTDPGGAVAQTGSRTVVAATSFGWFLNCTDCIGGPASATVSNFDLSPIPEPSSVALLLAGVAAVAGISARRSRRRN